jgi:hypothetical protein
MLSRPFQVEVEPLPADETVNLVVSVRWPTTAELTQATRAAADASLQAFALFGAWGGAAGARYAPPGSNISMIPGSPLQGHNELVWKLTTTHIDPGALFIIENLVHAGHVQVAPISSLCIQSTLIPGPRSQAHRRLPRAHLPCPFEVERDDDSPQLAIEVDFSARQKPAEMEVFRAAWDAWELLCMRGGFADETYIPERSTMRVDEDLHIASTGLFARYVQVFVADEALDGLVNMLQAFHARVTEIEHLEID